MVVIEKIIFKAIRYIVLLMNSEDTSAKKTLSKQELYNIALKKHIKWMRSLGLNVNDDGYIIKSRSIRRRGCA